MLAKNHQELITQEFERFIEFGAILDRTTRRYLVQYFHNKLTPDTYIVPNLNDAYFQYFRKALDDLFSINHLLPICRTNEHISRQIVLDTLYWLRKTYDKVRTKNLYETEVQRLENWSITPMHLFVRRWNVLTNWLQQTYARDELNADFYASRFKSIISGREWSEISTDDKQALERLLQDLLAQWDARLNAKVLHFQLSKFDEEKQQYEQLLDAKLQEYIKLVNLISPFAQYVGQYWDMSRQLWQETSFDVLRQYDDLLKNEQSIKALADLLGNMREAMVEMTEQTLEKTIVRQEWVIDEDARAEIAGVHESNDLNQLISSEASLLADHDTEILFLKKYADSNLLTFRYEDRRLVRSEHQVTEVFNRVRQKEKGPFIVCIDTSESMTGRPEQLAKVLCLGILKMAAQANRRAFLINFSTGIQTLDLHDIANSIDEIAKFLKMSFYGGTDVSLPIYEALRQLQTHQYEDADVLIISDFIMYRVDTEVLEQVRFFQQNKGTQFHSLTLSDDPNLEIIRRFDTNWLYDPTEKGIIRALTTGLKDIINRF